MPIIILSQIYIVSSFTFFPLTYASLQLFTCIILPTYSLPIHISYYHTIACKHVFHLFIYSSITIQFIYIYHIIPFHVHLSCHNFSYTFITCVYCSCMHHIHRPFHLCITCICVPFSCFTFIYA